MLKERYCPICGENLNHEPFCSKHGDVSGFPTYRYLFWFIVPNKLINIYWRLKFKLEKYNYRRNK